MGAREPRDDFAIEARGEKDEPSIASGEVQIGDWDLPFPGDAGATEIRDLVVAQDGPGEDVSDAALGEMDDLREQGLGMQRFLLPHVSLDVAKQLRVGMAEAAQERRAAGTHRAQRETKVARRERGFGGGRHGRKHGKCVGRLRRLFRRQLIQFFFPKHDFLAAALERFAQLAQKQIFARFPSGCALVLGGKIQAPEQW